eukprot:31993-Prymnesium_polylepis.1
MSVKPSETYDTGGSDGGRVVVEWRPRLREALALRSRAVVRAICASRALGHKAYGSKLMNSALRHPGDTSAVTMPEKLGLSLLVRRTAVRIRTN